MQDSVSEDHPDELDASTEDLTTATFQFTFKTFLFAGTEKCKLVKAKIPKVDLSTAMSAVTVEILPKDIDQFQKDYPDKEVSATIRIKPNDIDQFQKDYPNQQISAVIDKLVAVEVSSEVESPSAMIDVYEGIPIIEKIDFGFYVVPRQHQIVPYIQSVDNGDFGEHKHADLSGYISSDMYSMPKPHMTYDPDGIEISSFQDPLSGEPDYYESVDTSCTIAPYVDKLYWRIDAASQYPWPNNVVAERCGGVDLKKRS